MRGTTPTVWAASFLGVLIFSSGAAAQTMEFRAAGPCGGPLTVADQAGERPGSLSPRAEAAGSDPVFWQAHRGGGAKEAPDNTKGAFAYTWGLGGIPEADIRTTKDGVIICLHDATLARTTTAPKGIRGAKVTTLTFDQIREWDAGVRFSPRFKGERVPSLEEVFLEMRGEPQRQLYLDIKDTDLGALGRLINRFSVAGQLLVASPRQGDCRTVKRLNPKVRTMIWIGGSAADIKRKFARVVASGFDGLDQVQLHLNEKRGAGPFRYQLEADFLQEALRVTREAGVDLEVFPFKFDQASLHGLLDLGICWYATDEPKRFKEALGAWRGR